jgi:hypothetical protein
MKLVEMINKRISEIESDFEILANQERRDEGCFDFSLIIRTFEGYKILSEMRKFLTGLTIDYSDIPELDDSFLTKETIELPSLKKQDDAKAQSESL